VSIAHAPVSRLSGLAQVTFRLLVKAIGKVLFKLITFWIDSYDSCSSSSYRLTLSQSDLSHSIVSSKDVLKVFVI